MPTRCLDTFFLYEGVLIPGSTVEAPKVPVVQMLSKKNDINAIAYWLMEWKVQFLPYQKKPYDFSLALLYDIVRAFTPYPDLLTYINHCFEVLMEKDSGGSSIGAPGAVPHQFLLQDKKKT